MRAALPKGQRAVHPETFIELIDRSPPGVEFRKFGPIGSVGKELASMVRGGGRRVYLFLDDKGRRLETRTSCSDLTLARCPDGATFVLGGTRGYVPYSTDMIATFIRESGSPDLHKVSFGSRQQHASQIVSHLRVMDDEEDLRNARAMTFYTTQEDAERNPISTTIVGASEDPDLRGIRAITILPRHEPSTSSVKYIFPLTKA